VRQLLKQRGDDEPVGLAQGQRRQGLQAAAAEQVAAVGVVVADDAADLVAQLGPLLTTTWKGPRAAKKPTMRSTSTQANRRVWSTFRS
jgi:hypothetical protein